VTCYLCGIQGHISISCPTDFTKIKGNLRSKILKMKDEMIQELKDEKEAQAALKAKTQRIPTNESEAIKTE